MWSKFLNWMKKGKCDCSLRLNLFQALLFPSHVITSCLEAYTIGHTFLWSDQLVAETFEWSFHSASLMCKFDIYIWMTNFAFMKICLLFSLSLFLTLICYKMFLEQHRMSSGCFPVEDAFRWPHQNITRRRPLGSTRCLRKVSWKLHWRKKKKRHKQDMKISWILRKT